MIERPAKSPGRIVILTVISIGIVVGIAQRATPLAGAFLFGDELHSIGALSLPWSVLVGRFDAVGSGLALPLIQKALVALFGASLPVLRAVAFLPALLLIGIVYIQTRQQGRTSAAPLAALLVAVAPVFVFYGHFGRSYSLAALLCMGVAVACGRAPDRRTDDVLSWPRVCAIACLGGLAVYAHLVSVFFLAGLGVGVGLRQAARLGPSELWRDRALVGFGGAALLAVLLHWPALDSLMAFVGQKSDQVYYAEFGPLDVVRVLAGSSIGAGLAIVALLASAVAEARDRRFEAAPLLTATFVPPLLLFFASPYGDAYAYARYLLPSAASACVLIALGAVRAGASLRERAPACPAELLGIALAALLLLAGPRGPFGPSLGPFVNSYLGLTALPAFSDGVPEHPDYYDRIAGVAPPLTVLEMPALRNRAVHYMAALQRWHGQDVRFATVGPIVPGAPPLDSRLYVDLSRIADAKPDIDLLIVHRRVVDEVGREWARVYAPWPDETGDALLDRHRTYGHDLPSVAGAGIDSLEQVLGEPEHADVDVVVWRLRERVQ